MKMMIMMEKGDTMLVYKQLGCKLCNDVGKCLGKLC